MSLVTQITACAAAKGRPREFCTDKAAGRPQVLFNVTRGRQGGGYVPVKIK